METITYDAYLARMKREWKLSEHIGVIAPTGGGKTWIVRDLLTLKKHAVVVATKAKDKTLDLYVKEDGFKKYEDWPPYYQHTHIMLWKKAKELGYFQEQRWLIYSMMNDLYKRGGYALYLDDLYYISETLRLKRPLQMMYTQVRSNGVSILASMQRPAWVPLEAVSQSTYLILFRIRSRVDIERAADGMGIDRKELIGAIAELGDFEFLLLENGKEPIKVEKRPM